MQTLVLHLYQLRDDCYWYEIRVKTYICEISYCNNCNDYKMIVVPIIVLIGFKYFYGIDQTWVKVTIIEVAMPPMTMATVLAIKVDWMRKS